MLAEGRGPRPAGDGRAEAAKDAGGGDEDDEDDAFEFATPAATIAPASEERSRIRSENNAAAAAAAAGWIPARRVSVAAESATFEEASLRLSADASPRNSSRLSASLATAMLRRLSNETAVLDDLLDETADAAGGWLDDSVAAAEAAAGGGGDDASSDEDDDATFSSDASSDSASVRDASTEALPPRTPATALLRVKPGGVAWTSPSPSPGTKTRGGRDGASPREADAATEAEEEEEAEAEEEEEAFPQKRVASGGVAWTSPTRTPPSSRTPRARRAKTRLREGDDDGGALAEAGRELEREALEADADAGDARGAPAAGPSPAADTARGSERIAPTASMGYSALGTFDTDSPFPPEFAREEEEEVTSRAAPSRWRGNVVFELNAAVKTLDAEVKAADAAFAAEEARAAAARAGASLDPPRRERAAEGGERPRPRRARRATRREKKLGKLPFLFAGAVLNGARKVGGGLIGRVGGLWRTLRERGGRDEGDETTTFEDETTFGEGEGEESTATLFETTRRRRRCARRRE